MKKVRYKKSTFMAVLREKSFCLYSRSNAKHQGRSTFFPIAENVTDDYQTEN